MTNQELLDLLFNYQDEKYADFAAKLIPSVPRDRFIGIRSPKYKPILKTIRNDPVIPSFLASLPHKYHEENCLHAALINQIAGFDECVATLERFLPYIDNWAVCDSVNPDCFHTHRGELLPKMKQWIASEEPYTRRCGMRMLMIHFLGEDFRSEYLDQPADLRSDEYYVNMMTAWLFAEALAQQWDATLPYLESCRLDPWTHNKTVQKACESFRISEERKIFLKTLKVKAGKKPT